MEWVVKYENDFIQIPFVVATSIVTLACVVGIGLNDTVVRFLILGVVDISRLCAFAVLEVAGSTDVAVCSEILIMLIH